MPIWTPYEARAGEFPILVYNPHPYKVDGIFECEFNLEDFNYNEEFSLPVVSRDGRSVASQAEKESGNTNLDWRKSIVFSAELEPSQMNRFDCSIRILPKKPLPELKERGGIISLKTAELEVDINCRTGLMDRFCAHGAAYLKPNAFLPLVLEDNDDPWRMDTNAFRDVKGSFGLMSGEEGSAFSGVKSCVLESVRVIEDGDVRSVVEAVFKYNNSFLCLHYKLPKRGTEMQLQARVFWNEKSTMLKLSIPTMLHGGKYLGQVAYGVEQLPGDGSEAESQKWSAVVSPGGDSAFTCINDGSDNYIIRLFEPAGHESTISVRIPFLNISHQVSLRKFEIKTLMLDTCKRTISEADLMENRLDEG